MLGRRLLRGPIQLQAAAWLLRRGHAGYRALTPTDRTRARELLQHSKGVPTNLTHEQRSELRRIATEALRATQTP